eukprot:Skav211653  [mRNA]  locus=scaffold6216:359:7387:+ [translate_table: standard]
MVIGPLTALEAAQHCGCYPEDLCPGPLAAIDEGDKVRTIYDGSYGKANAHIQNQTQERTTAPTVLDCIQALHWLHSASHTPAPTTGASGPDGWCWPTNQDQWVILKADVTKAHRRVKVLAKDWRFQVAQLDNEWWINKVGTYGMASAQLYWGRLAALLLRLVYHIFPQVDWGFVFVDDFCWLLRQTTSGTMATAILATLIALGTPLSWKKTHLAEINTWLGFVVHPNIPQVQMAAPKHVIVMELLTQLIEDKVFTAKEIEKALGRIQWATAVCPLTKSLMQPFWAWKMAVTSSGRPPKFVRLLALLLQHLFTRPYKQLSPYLPKSTWWGCSDASASSEGQAFIGGWLSSQPDPGKDTVWWFHMEITPQEFPWAFKEGDPKKRIAALELFATLILCHSMLDHQGHTTSHVRLPVGSDNQGNVFALLNMASKKPHTAILLMELILTLHTSGSSLAPSHVPRELNQWADELTHTDFVGFNSSLRIDVKAYLAKLLLVPRLRPDGQVDFTDSSTQNPGTGKGSRYHEDLSVMEQLGLLLPGAVVVADNVLKPGSPLFLWRLCKGKAYENHIAPWSYGNGLVRVREFAMPSEDWMSVSVLRPEAAEQLQLQATDMPKFERGKDRSIQIWISDRCIAGPWPAPPEALLQLQWESDRIRQQATRPGGAVEWVELCNQ